MAANPFGTGMDPLGIGASIGRVNAAWCQAVPGYVGKLATLNRAMGDVGTAAARDLFELATRSLDGSRDETAALLDGLKRGAATMRRYHSVFSRWVDELVAEAPGVGGDDRQRAAFWLGQLMQVLAPGNYFGLNPGAVQRCLKSEGRSLQDGLDNWTSDAVRGAWPAPMVDADFFTPGENIAATAGAVVFRNPLMELIQYAPLTETVYRAPIVMIQPWINKYYIFDLQPANSFVRYLVAQGFTVFITSWKNPTGEMRGTRLDDYMLHGALRAIQVAAEICDTKQVHATGYCIGGTVLAALMAWLSRDPSAAEGGPVVDWTLFSTLLDFSEPGDLGVFIHPDGIKAAERLMRRAGYLDKRYLGLVFRMLNPEGLIWRYHINNYLHGQAPPRSDMLFWNSDGTRLPEAMCAFYLRAFYLENRLVKKERLTLGGRSIDLGAIQAPLYAVGGRKDHICPWRGSYNSLLPLNTETRYVLTEEGHITGIVNPPSPYAKKRWWGGRFSAAQPPEAWAGLQPASRGSWWPDWIAWLARNAPRTGPVPQLGSTTYPVLAPAPGAYVLEP
jgi:polyhydroxyalkanoate synthase